jgi:N4-gp56 family major capsid protein
MALQTRLSAGLVDTLQDYYSQQLLEHQVDELHLAQFAQQGDLPKKTGADTVRYFRRAKAAASNVQALGEGVPITVYRELEFEHVDVALVQYGEAAKISDILSVTDLISTLDNQIAAMGEDAALHADGTIRDAIVSGTTAAGQKRYSQALANFAALAAATAAGGCAVDADFLDAVTRLKKKNAKRFGGHFACIAPPDVLRDLQVDTKWVDVNKYANAEEIMKGEVGRWRGLRFFETTNEFREDSEGAEGTYAADGDIFTSIVLGKGAFGAPKLAEQNPFSPQIIICNKPDKSDPLNQFITAGWKAFWNAKLLEEDWAITIRSKSQHA